MGRDRGGPSSLRDWTFQFTRPHGARPFWMRSPSVSRVFQFTRPHGARQDVGRCMKRALMFQFTRPHGARLLAARTRVPQVVVSIHAPAWGATPIGSTTTSTAAGFNSRARMGRDDRLQRRVVGTQGFQFTRPHGARPADDIFIELLDVSIHAPAWGATRRENHGGARAQVSIHAPAWGATMLTPCFLLFHEFQFTRPHGARLPEMLMLRTAFEVSIHAPAWGATASRRPSPT